MWISFGVSRNGNSTTDLFAWENHKINAHICSLHCSLGKQWYSREIHQLWIRERILYQNTRVSICCSVIRWIHIKCVNGSWTWAKPPYEILQKVDLMRNNGLRCPSLGMRTHDNILIKVYFISKSDQTNAIIKMCCVIAIALKYLHIM